MVHPHYQRKGIWEKLYRLLIQETHGKNILSLVNVKNAPSWSAHRKLGFISMKKVVDIYAQGKGDMQVLLRLKN